MSDNRIADCIRLWHQQVTVWQSVNIFVSIGGLAGSACTRTQQSGSSALAFCDSEIVRKSGSQLPRIPLYAPDPIVRVSSSVWQTGFVPDGGTGRV